MPAHDVYQVLTDIWSGGCNPQLYYALPVLFSLEVLSLFLSSLGVYRRCHYAVLAEETQEEVFRKRLDAAMAFERKRNQEKKEAQAKVSTPRQGSDSAGDEQDAEANERERKKLSEVIRQEDSETRMERTRSHRDVNFGALVQLSFR